VNIAPIARATAAGAVKSWAPTHRAQVTPAEAEAMLLPITDQGCASGLAGTASWKTAEAPSGATSLGSAGHVPVVESETTPVSEMPVGALRQPCGPSVMPTVTGADKGPRRPSSNRAFTGLP
jgi:hypothetical protein